MDAARELRAIAASIARVALDELDATRPLAHLKEQLAEANLGLISVDGPASFAWPGSWIAIVRLPNGTEVPVAMFGVPSGALHDEGRHAIAAGEIVDGLVIAPLDLDRPHGSGAYGHVPAEPGVIVGLFTAPAATAPCVPHETCHVLAGIGIEGDRYAAGDGTFSSVQRGGQAVTLIAQEAIDEARQRGADIDAITTRRNIVTQGIDLDALIGHCFTVGDVTLRAVRLAEPCAHLERITSPGVLRGMVHLGGIRANALTTGTIRIGDRVRLCPDHHQETP